MTELWARVLMALEHSKLTQTSVERELVDAGLTSKGRFSKLKYTAQTSIDPRIVEAIADICGVDFHWLLLGRGAMLPPRTAIPRAGRIHDSDPPPDQTDIRIKGA